MGNPRSKGNAVSSTDLKFQEGTENGGSEDAPRDTKAHNPIKTAYQFQPPGGGETRAANKRGSQTADSVLSIEK